MTDHFTNAELSCSHCDQLQINPQSLERLERVRVKYGQPMLLSSAYRCPEYNAFVSTTGDDGPHVQGHAFDVLCYHGDAYVIAAIALAEGFTGIGYSQHGEHHNRFVHLDDLPARPNQPRPTIWSYPG